MTQFPNAELEGDIACAVSEAVKSVLRGRSDVRDVIVWLDGQTRKFLDVENCVIVRVNVNFKS